MSRIAGQLRFIVKNRLRLIAIGAFAVMVGLAGCKSDQDMAREALARKVEARRAAQAESRALYTKAMRLYHKEDAELTQAADLLVRAVALDDRHARAWLALGVVQQQREQIAEAAKAYQEAAKLSRARFEPYYNLGTLYESVGSYSRAIEAYETALELAPDNLHVIENLARAYVRAKRDLPRAQNLIDQALEREFRPDWRRWLELQSISLATQVRGGQQHEEVVP